MAERAGQDRWRRYAGTLLGVLAVLVPVLALGSWRAQGLGWSLLLTGHHAENVAIAVWEGLFGVVLVRARPRNPLGWWMLLVATANGLTVFCEALADRLIAAGADSPARWASWLAAWSWVTGLVPLYSVLLVVYPSGRATSRAGRVLVRCALIATGLLSLGLAVSQDVMQGVQPGQQNPLTGGRLAGLGEVLSSAGALAALVVVAVAVAQSVLRMRSAASPERQQLAWLLTTTLPVIALLLVAPAVLLLVATVLSPLGMAVGVLRHRLLDIQLVLRRTLVYGPLVALVALVALGYAVVVAAGRAIPQSAFASVLAAALVAVGLRPAHQLVQVAVTRLVYGDEPARAVGRLANVINDPARAGDLLAAVVEVVCSALKLPAAVLVVDDRVTGGPLPAGSALHELVLRHKGSHSGC